jgi:hypothetical protein
MEAFVRTPERHAAQTIVNRMRLREIERLAKYDGAADTHDFHSYLTAAARHTEHTRDPAFTLECWSRRCGREATDNEITAALREAMLGKRRSYRITADALAESLNVTYAKRQRLGLKTIGATDVPKAQRTKLRKARDRDRKRAEREANGATPREQSHSRTQPWLAAGFNCRKTWERHGKPMAPDPVSQVRPQSSSFSLADELATRRPKGRATSPHVGQGTDRAGASVAWRPASQSSNARRPAASARGRADCIAAPSLRQSAVSA